MDKKIIIIGAGGIAAGTFLGWGISQLLPKNNGGQLVLPNDFLARAVRLSFRDTVANQLLSGPVPLSTNIEAGYTFWLVGYGLVGKGLNDVLVELVKRPDATFYCNIVKLGSNAVEIKRDITIMNTLPSLSGVPENTLEQAYLVLTL
jgi:hypothetical protein